MLPHGCCSVPDQVRINISLCSKSTKEDQRRHYRCTSSVLLLRHAVAGVVLSWVWSFVWNTPPLFGWGSYELEGIKTSCAPNWYSRDVGNMSYIIIYFLICFAVPFTTIMVSYSRLLWTLRQVRTAQPRCLLIALISQYPAFASQVVKLQVSGAGSTNRMEVQVARMVVVMVLAFLVTWLPYAAMALAVIIDSSLYIDPRIATIPVYFAKSSTVYNPIIYIFMNRQVVLHYTFIVTKKWYMHV